MINLPEIKQKVHSLESQQISLSNLKSGPQSTKLSHNSSVETTLDSNSEFIYQLNPGLLQPDEPPKQHPASLHGRINPKIPGTNPETRQPSNPGYEFPGRIQPVPL